MAQTITDTAKNTQPRDPVSRLWDTLKSMKFAIVLLLVLTALTVINLFANEFIVDVGGSEPGLAYSTYSDAYGEPRASILTLLQMYSPYRSWWYTILLGLLTLSLLVCVIDRAPLVWKLVTGTRYLAAESQYKGHHHRALIEGDANLKQRLLDAIRAAGFTVTSRETARATLVHGRKAAIAHSGSWVVHVGFILLVTGAALIARGQYHEQVSGLPGDLLMPDESAWGFNVRVDDFQIEYNPLRVGQYIQLDNGRRIGRLDKLIGDSAANVELLWPAHGMESAVALSRLSNRIDRRFSNGRLDQMNIADYVATLTVIENGREVETRKIEVNSPLRYRGYRFYQSSFNDSRTDANGRWTTILDVRRDSGSPLVWCGILVISIGLLLGLYLAPREIFARIETTDKGARVLLAGNSKGRALEFEQQFRTMVERIQQPAGEKRS